MSDTQAFADEPSPKGLMAQEWMDWCSWAIQRIATLTAQNAELRREISEHVLRADSLRAEVRRLEEELELDESDAVSEAVERIVEALEKMRPKTRECAASSPVFTGYDDAMSDAILILRSRDWSKGDG